MLEQNLDSELFVDAVQKQTCKKKYLLLVLWMSMWSDAKNLTHFYKVTLMVKFWLLTIYKCKNVLSNGVC